MRPNYEMPQTDKSIETESRLVVSRVGGIGVTANGYKFLLGVTKMIFSVPVWFIVGVFWPHPQHAEIPRPRMEPEPFQ